MAEIEFQIEPRSVPALYRKTAVIWHRVSAQTGDFFIQTIRVPRTSAMNARLVRTQVQGYADYVELVSLYDRAYGRDLSNVDDANVVEAADA